MENGGAARDDDMQSENLAPPESQEGRSAFPWMGHYQATPVEAFPTLHGPIVHEGFVPDDDGGISLGNRAEDSADWSASGSITPMFHTGLTGRLGDQITNHALPRSQNEMARYPTFGGRHGSTLDQYSDDDNDSSVSYDDSQ
jgi:hypothetical protein